VPDIGTLSSNWNGLAEDKAPPTSRQGGGLTASEIYQGALELERRGL
jgi:hypothetical protein